MNLEEGYDDPKVQTEGETIMLGERKPRIREVTDILTADTVFEKSVATAGNGSRRKRGRPRKNRAKESDPIFAAIAEDEVLSSHLKDTTDANSLAELLVGKKIRVYWPCYKVIRGYPNIISCITMSLLFATTVAATTTFLLLITSSAAKAESIVRQVMINALLSSDP
ncbi:hypothetical protein LINPERHAP1_LOCUS19789 [Linum perenne]